MSCVRPLARTARGRRNESDLDCTHLDRRMMRRGRHPWFDTWQGAIARNPVNDDVHCARALSVSAGGDCQSRAPGAALRAAAETTIARFDRVIVSVDGAVSLLNSLGAISLRVPGALALADGCDCLLHCWQVAPWAGSGIPNMRSCPLLSAACAWRHPAPLPVLM